MLNLARDSAFIAVALTLCALPLAVHAAETSDESEFDQVPLFLHAKDLLAKETLKGERYTVEDRVINNGVRNTYTVNSDYGKATVYNDEQLAARIDEINACATMDEINKALVYGRAVGKSVAAPLSIAKGLVTHPVDTVGNIGTGVGQFFQDLGYAIEGEDPYQSGFGKTILGYDNARRGFAYGLGVNPYSTWQPFEERLSSIAWTSTSGGLTVSGALQVAGGGVATTVVSYSQTAGRMRQLATKLPPEKLKDINEEKLRDMGLPEHMIELFLSNYYYDPLEATRLVGALDEMKDVKGRSDFVVYRAALATSTPEAMLSRQWAELMENYHRYVEKIGEIVMVSGGPFMVIKDRSVVMVAPTDYMAWTKLVSIRANQFYDGLEQQGIKGRKEMWFMRKVTPKAKQNLEKIGFVVKSEVGDLIPPEAKKAMEKARSAELQLSKEKGEKELAKKAKEQPKEQPKEEQE